MNGHQYLGVSAATMTVLADVLSQRSALTPRDAAHAAETLLAVLAEHGMILPPGVQINAVWRVAEYTVDDHAAARRLADRHAVHGVPAPMERAWRVRADGLDVITGWTVCHA